MTCREVCIYTHSSAANEIIITQVSNFYRQYFIIAHSSEGVVVFASSHTLDKFD